MNAMMATPDWMRKDENTWLLKFNVQWCPCKRELTPMPARSGFNVTGEQMACRQLPKACKVRSVELLFEPRGKSVLLVQANGVVPSLEEVSNLALE